MNNPPNDLLWKNITSLPYFRGLLRAVEGRYYQSMDLPGPVLDLGCGDGHFASVTFSGTLDAGLDPWVQPIREAQGRGKYKLHVLAQGSQIPFPEQYFQTVISNSVLEHIQDIQPVLNDVARVTRMGGSFIFCVPNHQFDGSLSIGSALEKFGWKTLAGKYRNWFEKIARHKNLDSPEVWTKRLEKAGFEVIQWWHYFSPQAQSVMEWGHFMGLPSLIIRKLTGKWILAPTWWNLGWTYRILEKYYHQTQECENGVCTFYVARRV